MAPGGVRMILDPQEWLQIDFMRGQPTEPMTAALFEQLLRPGDTLIDIGAHVGWLSLIGAKAVGKSGRVIAVDPQPYNCDRMMANAQANGFQNVTVVSGAAGEISAPVLLANQAAVDKARLTLQGSGVNDTGVRFLTQVYPLSQLFEIFELSSVRLLKVDVEGFELPVFRGATPVLNRIDNIIFEYLPENADNFLKINTLLTEAGFELLTVSGDKIDSVETLPEFNIWARRKS